MNCISTDGNAVLARFGLETVNPYEHLVVSVPWRPEEMMDQTLFQDLSFSNLPDDSPELRPGDEVDNGGDRKP